MISLKRMFDHLHWANQQILKTLKVNEPLESHKARQFFSHILCAEQVWLTRIQGKDSSKLPIWADVGLEDCEKLLKLNEEGFSEILTNLSEENHIVLVQYKNSKGEEFQTSLIDILTHVALHGHYHRGQVNLQLRGEGMEPVGIDFITFVRES
ncbi:DinB family protein [Metabacillus halosaccharovorans]|uniref:DinB family protein n=1 Tax=Metabacillus halosaccharovorans TaxID=930124 RepID=UPI001C1FD6A0|nr:DinB family protein [Metabacillus halosaccharovorans]MBU7592937.1 damage-inducible protein DinB [Metabacillus halosaccharovorans]